jgi:hypothetical protein
VSHRAVDAGGGPTPGDHHVEATSLGVSKVALCHSLDQGSLLLGGHCLARSSQCAAGQDSSKAAGGRVSTPNILTLSQQQQWYRYFPAAFTVCITQSWNSLFKSLSSMCDQLEDRGPKEIVGIWDVQSKTVQQMRFEQAQAFNRHVLPLCCSQQAKATPGGG